MKLRRKSDGKIEHCLKMRGITLDWNAVEKQHLQYDTFKKRVFDLAESGHAEPSTITYPNFLRPSIRDGAVFSLSLSKIVRPYFSKGIFDRQTFDILPFGFIRK